MSPRDENIRKTASLLSLHFQQKQLFTKPKTVERYTLHIKKEHIFDAGLTIPDFLLSADVLAEKGYLLCARLVDENNRNILKIFIDNPSQFPEINIVKEKLNQPDKLQKLHDTVMSSFKNVRPKSLDMDFREDEKPDYTIDDLLNDGIKGIGTDLNDLVCVVIIMPFRDVERVYNKMQSGLTFDQVKDPGLWYEADKCTLHFEDTEMVLEHQNKPNKSHYALMSLFDKKEHYLDYVDIPQFDPIKDKTIEKKTFSDSLRGLVKKHPDLEQVFTIGTHTVSITQNYIEHTH